MANNTNTKRIEVLENQVSEMSSDIKKILEMLTSKPTNEVRGASNSKITTNKVDREAKRQAEKDEFKKTHKLIRSSKENRKLVYAEMEKQGIKEYNEKDYKRIAKGLGVLGKNGSVVSTWEERK